MIPLKLTHFKVDITELTPDELNNLILKIEKNGIPIKPYFSNTVLQRNSKLICWHHTKQARLCSCGTLCNGCYSKKTCYAYSIPFLTVEDILKYELTLLDEIRGELT